MKRRSVGLVLGTLILGTMLSGGAASPISLTDPETYTPVGWHTNYVGSRLAHQEKSEATGQPPVSYYLRWGRTQNGDLMSVMETVDEWQNSAFEIGYKGVFAKNDEGVDTPCSESSEIAASVPSGVSVQRDWTEPDGDLIMWLSGMPALAADVVIRPGTSYGLSILDCWDEEGADYRWDDTSTNIVLQEQIGEWITEDPISTAARATMNVLPNENGFRGVPTPEEPMLSRAFWMNTPWLLDPSFEAGINHWSGPGNNTWRCTDTAGHTGHCHMKLKGNNGNPRMQGTFTVDGGYYNERTDLGICQPDDPDPETRCRYVSSVNGNAGQGSVALRCHNSQFGHCEATVKVRPASGDVPFNSVYLDIPAGGWRVYNFDEDNWFPMEKFRSFDIRIALLNGETGSLDVDDVWLSSDLVLD